MKPCIKCGSVDIVHVGKYKKRRCRTCHNRYAKQYQRDHPEYKQERKRRDPDYFKRHSRKVRYGLTENDVEAMKIAQGHKCLICREIRKLVVDHCHKNGNVRGLLCAPCNGVLGRVENEEWMTNARAYLSRGRVQ